MQIFRSQFRAMGCDNEIIAAAPDAAAAGPALTAAAREVLRIEHKYSRYRRHEESIVHAINAAAGAGPVTVDDETLQLLDFADTMYKRSGGLFDITSGVLRRAWDFSTPVLPPPEVLEPLLALVGWPRVRREGHRIALPLAGMEIDFGGFGKEYAADRAAGMLRAGGIRHGYVNLGGDIRALGGHPEGKPWLIGVQNPDKPGTVIANVPLTDEGLATSGDYEKFVTISGRRYSHILNPVTGFPVNCWRSVSILGVSALWAGAHATIAMLKQRDAVTFLRESNCKFVMVDTAGAVVTS